MRSQLLLYMATPCRGLHCMLRDCHHQYTISGSHTFAKKLHLRTLKVVAFLQTELFLNKQLHIKCLSQENKVVPCGDLASGILLPNSSLPDSPGSIQTGHEKKAVPLVTVQGIQSFEVCTRRKKPKHFVQVFSQRAYRIMVNWDHPT